MKRLLLVLLILSTSVMAADYLDTFDAYEIGVRNNLGIALDNTTYLTDSTIHQAVRQSIVDINNAACIVQTTKNIITTSANVYAFDSLNSVQSVAWQKGDSIKSIEYVPRAQWFSKQHQSCRSQIGTLARPSYWDTTGTQILVFPSPVITGDTLRVIGCEKVYTLNAAASLTQIPQRHRNRVLAYATYLCARQKQHPLTGAFLAESGMGVVSGK